MPYRPSIKDEQKALQFAGKMFLGLSATGLATALKIGVLLEVRRGEQDH